MACDKIVLLILLSAMFLVDESVAVKALGVCTNAILNVTYRQPNTIDDFTRVQLTFLTATADCALKWTIVGAAPVGTFLGLLNGTLQHIRRCPNNHTVRLSVSTQRLDNVGLHTIVYQNTDNSRLIYKIDGVSYNHSESIFSCSVSQIDTRSGDGYNYTELFQSLQTPVTYSEAFGCINRVHDMLPNTDWTDTFFPAA